ncbi:hypothetical protein [Nocardioides marmotae]|uniref:hypothetical protein n=1 Tax=Nocardioides marmotae TaxID=2663857 RepID=UPI0012B582A0|nr:hypothetical protein [Nocardioides marmotae]MBC9734257.1 hypothetical protein [Nocardioides marmotae]MTB85359.1 hypothetical protein [Nocardioides marmotae]
MDGAGGNRYGDVAGIRALATRLREQGAEVAAEAERLVRLAEATGWTGRAADAMRERAHDGARGLRRTAGLHEDAAEALDRHAAEVERRLELVAAAERTFAALLDGARDRLGGLVDRLLDQVALPPPGHRDWLTFDLPRFLR